MAATAPKKGRPTPKRNEVRRSTRDAQRTLQGRDVLTGKPAQQ